ncbi:MAG: double-strand break repair protein AddB [Magnetovibrio sp.]|nr:double-strand break repair protein AddB [Magnetovibrio sp.]
MSQTNIFTIPSDQNFVEALARGILNKVGGAPHALAQVTVLLPTRRACRSLREAFLRLSDGKPMLLPQMMPLGDVDEDDLALSTSGTAYSLDLAPAMGSLKRTVLLARYVMKMDSGTSPDQAVRLAEELANLLDQVHTEGLDLAKLPGLVQDKELSLHWEKTVKFLSIIGETWPQVLAAQGLLDSAKRRDKVLRARAQSWARNPPQGLLIAAGSTGTIPATADLLHIIAHSPLGNVVLPGLDNHAHDDVWANIEPSHPQFGMAQLLKKLGVDRTDVKLWDGVQDSHTQRATVLNRALVPASATHLWRGDALNDDVLDQGLDGLERVDCPGPREEAQTIALILRQALNTPDQTSALITPDRQLARRVSVELTRWGVDVDDSAGQPLDQTPPGAFFNLVSEMVADQFHPVSLLACLKHPLAAGGFAPHQMRYQVRALEAICLRGPRPEEGLAGLEAKFRVFNNDADTYAQTSLKKMGLKPTHARNILAMLQEVSTPFSNLLKNTKSCPCDLLTAHVKLCEALARTDSAQDERHLWAGDAGDALSTFIAEAHEALLSLGPISPEQYPALIKALMMGRAVRPQFGKHPRVFIWGPLEARLQRTDITVLGGLNEGTWPGDVEASPWMSRPMMQAFGLGMPERRVGLSAHDFVQAASSPKVYLTRSERSGSSPQVPSRWLVRLNTLLGDRALTSQGQWLDWAKQLTQPDGPPRPCKAPKPTPPVSARPKRLSVTAIEKWMRDPYAIYAGRILNLQPLDDIDADASAADKGNVIHLVLERFVTENMDSLPDDPVTDLLRIGEEVFREKIASPGVRAFWWPRFKRIAAWFVDFEIKRRTNGLKPALIEERGQIDLNDFTLSAQVDRMDLDSGGGLVILDYKTGQAPSTRLVNSGLTPQLPLEGVIALRGGFKNLKHATSLSGMMYVRLTGGRVAGEEKPIGLEGDEAMQKAEEGLRKLIGKFQLQDTPYLSRPRPMFESRFGDYDHLARVKEWTGEGDTA